MLDKSELSICSKINEQFKFDIEPIFKDLNYKIKGIFESVDLISQDRFFSLTIDFSNLRFKDRITLIGVLIRFMEREISNIPNELEALENQRANSRYWDDIQHFHETEGLSEKESKLSKIKRKLESEYSKLIQANKSK